MSGPELADFAAPDALIETLIVKNKLRDEHGIVRCWTCRVRQATVPTLECVVCIERRKKP